MGACPEMDLAVAEACAKSATVYFDHDLQRNVCLLLPGDVRFSPSSDWNDAMFAAERFNLFRQWGVEYGWEGLRFLTHCNGWCVVEWTKEGVGYAVVSSGKTGPLAICRAILKLHHGG